MAKKKKKKVNVRKIRKKDMTYLKDSYEKVQTGEKR